MEKGFRVNNFDLLRIFAATEVLLLHSFTHLKLPFPVWFKVLANFPGVPMFFVMSGFLISASYERNGELKNYFRNRILRIYPALWACIILSVFVIYFVSKISFVSIHGLEWFLSQCVGVIYTPDFLKNYGFGSYNGSLWTIPIELQFYIVLPITYLIVNLFTKKESKKTNLIFVIFLIFAIIGYIILAHFTRPDPETETKVQKILRYSFIPHIYLFFLGVLLQRVNAYESKIIKGKGLVWLIAYLLLCYLIPAGYVSDIIEGIFLGITTISLAYSYPGIANKILHGNDISYGVYIYHGLILGVLVELKMTGNYYSVLIVAVAAYIIAFISWRVLEKPIIQMKKNALRKAV